MHGKMAITSCKKLWVVWKVWNLFCSFSIVYLCIYKLCLKYLLSEAISKYQIFFPFCTFRLRKLNTDELRKFYFVHRWLRNQLFKCYTSVLYLLCSNLTMMIYDRKSFTTAKNYSHENGFRKSFPIEGKRIIENTTQQ